LKESRYLGSIVSSSLKSDADVEKRIRSAGAASGALRGVPGNCALEGGLRDKAHSVLVLTILLCGSEVWYLGDGLLVRLRSFQKMCCRAMCRITMLTTGRYRIPSAQLYRRLVIADVEQHHLRRLPR
jgi:hypothetical protein